MGKYSSKSLGTFDCKYDATIKLETETGIPEDYSQLNVVQKGMLVNSTPKLTHSEWVKEQHEDADIGSVIQLLKTDKGGKYMVKETNSSRM